MQSITGHHQAQLATLSISLLTDSDTSGHYTHERHYKCRLLIIARSLLLSNGVQAPAFSDIFSRVESGFNHFRSVIHDPRALLTSPSAVEKEIDASKQRVRSLRNAFAPISQFPPKVLARVFHFLSLYEPLFSGKSDLGWMRATHVCRIWRQVALGRWWAL